MLRIVARMPDMPSRQTARAAASLIVVREAKGAQAAGDALEFLMIRRAPTMRFAGGASVFPGGAVDPADRDHARALAPAYAGQAGEGGLADLAARIAAVRETIEEAGLAVGCGGDGAGSGAVAAMRDALCAGSSLAEAARAREMRFDFSALVPFARWCPPEQVAYSRFDTRFYLAATDGAAGALVPDGGETVQLAWRGAREMLARAAAGEASLLLPTRRNLERLARFDSIAALFAHAAAHPVRLITPWTEMRAGVPHLCIPEDAGYPVTAEPL